jgi:hypothetical protein
MRFLPFGCLLIAALISMANKGIAQNESSPGAPAFIIEALPDLLARRVEAQKELLRQFGLANPEKTSKGVVNALKIWTTDYRQVKVCFFSGSRALRSRIAKIAMEWKNAVPGIPLDFGDLEDPRNCKSEGVDHIRVGFAFTGYWSLVGQDSIKFAGQDEQSMNFAGFDTSPPDDSEFHATVLHEFGHAVGLEHEHQNPLSKCKDEFDWDKIYKWLAGPPNNWSKNVVDFNMGVLNEQGLLMSSFDKKSIMLYTFPPEYFGQGKQATCYSPQNTSLSDGDKFIVSKLYPRSDKEKKDLENEIKNAHLTAMKASGQTEGAKAVVMQLIEGYMP